MSRAAPWRSICNIIACLTQVGELDLIADVIQEISQIIWCSVCACKFPWCPLCSFAPAPRPVCIPLHSGSRDRMCSMLRRPTSLVTFAQLPAQLAHRRARPNPSAEPQRSCAL